MLDAPSINIKEAAKNFGTEEILKERLTRQEAILSGDNPAISAKCRTVFEMGQQILPTQHQLEAIKSRFVSKTESLGKAFSTRTLARRIKT